MFSCCCLLNSLAFYQWYETQNYKFDSCSATSTENYHLLYVKWTPIGFILDDIQLIVAISNQDFKNVMEWCPIF